MIDMPLRASPANALRKITGTVRVIPDDSAVCSEYKPSTKRNEPARNLRRSGPSMLKNLSKSLAIATLVIGALGLVACRLQGSARSPEMLLVGPLKCCS